MLALQFISYLQFQHKRIENHKKNKCVRIYLDSNQQYLKATTKKFQKLHISKQNKHSHIKRWLSQLKYGKKYTVSFNYKCNEKYEMLVWRINSNTQVIKL